MRRDDFSGAVGPMFWDGGGQGQYFSDKPKKFSGRQHFKTLPPPSTTLVSSNSSLRFTCETKARAFKTG